MQCLMVLIYSASSIFYTDFGMREIGNRFAFDRNEVLIAEFTIFADAEAEDFVSQAERNGGWVKYLLVVGNKNLVGLSEHS